MTPEDIAAAVDRKGALVSARTTPPGWPALVPPPDAPGWQQAAVAWLLDECPPDYRSYAGWRRHPIALAWLTVRHVEGQVAAMRTAYRDVRRELGPQLPPEALTDILSELQKEGLRLVAVQRSATMIYEAMYGKRYVPRL